MSSKTWHSVARSLVVLGGMVCLAGVAQGQTPAHGGYYRDPAVHGDTVIFTSEGDLWSVSVRGGAAHRLTSNSGVERMATISPDGTTVAFHAQYEGPGEVYTIPIEGGMPQRQTWDGDAYPEGWTPDGRLMVSTSRYSGLPDTKLVLLGKNGEREVLPLATAVGGSLFGRWEDCVFYALRQAVQQHQTLQGRDSREPVAVRWAGRGGAADGGLCGHVACPRWFGVGGCIFCRTAMA